MFVPSDIPISQRTVQCRTNLTAGHKYVMSAGSTRIVHYDLTIFVSATGVTLVLLV